MRRDVTVSLALIAAVAVAQNPTFVSRDKKVRIQFVTFVSQETSKGVQRMKLRGGVDARSEAQGIHATSQTVDLKMASVGKEYKLQWMEAVGNARMERASKAAGVDRTLVITGAKITYQAGVKEDAVQVAGPIKVTDNSVPKSSSMELNGANGQLTLDPNQKNKNGALKTATLTRNIRIDLLAKNGVDALHATGEKLVYVRTGVNATLTLTGGVKVKTDGPNAGELQDLREIVLELDQNNQIKKSRSVGE